MKQLYSCLRPKRRTFGLTKLTMTFAMVLAFVMTGTAANTYMEDTEAPVSVEFSEVATSSIDNLNHLNAVLNATESRLSFVSANPSMPSLPVDCPGCPSPDAAPVLSITSQEFMLACSDPMPTPPVVTATDDCDGIVDVQTFQIGSTEEATEICTTSEAIGVDSNWAVWLPVLNQFADNWVFLPGENGGFTRYADNSAIISGTVQSVENPARKFEMNVKLQGNYDWATWNSMMTLGNPQTNRLYKDQYGFGAMDDNYIDWSFYTIVAESSYLIGKDDFEGSYLMLSQAPSNCLFGAQVGQGANDTNGNYGLSTWFTYTGFIPDGSGALVATSGQGDINLDLDCNNPLNLCGTQPPVCYTYIAIDACGNAATEKQTYTRLGDTTPPVLTGCPADVQLECGTAPADVTVTATDDCGTATPVELSVTTAGTCPEIITRTWSSMDECGNTATCSQVITVVDTTPPTFDNTATSVTVECGNTIPDAPVLTATDSCSGAAVVTMSSSSVDGCGNTEVITRVWTATDACNNTATTSQTVTIVDTTPPTISAAADMTIECTQPVPAPSATADDTCGDAEWTVAIATTPGCGNTYTEVRTYTATDECNNTATTTQTITIVDITAPTIVAAADLTIECTQPIPAPSAMANDTCGDAEWTVAIATTPGCGNTYTEVRTYTATDECNNTATATQTITIVDTTAPTIVAAADMTIECGNDVPAPAATATDTCGDATWTVAIATTPGCGNTYTEVRTYTATDDCNNTATATQTITIVDTTAPSITAAADMTIECGNDVPVPAATATDTCGDATWTVAIATTPGCGNTYTEVRTYTATDDCNNTATAMQTITIVDTTIPEIGGLEPFMTVECDEIPDAADAVVSDNCGSVSVTVVDAGFSGGCEGAIQRIYTATDECGNTNTYTQVINVVDVTAPVLVDVPADLTIECGTTEPTFNVNGY